MYRFYPLACRIPHKENVTAVALWVRMRLQAWLQAWLQAR
jgi:hypothetical protein